MDIALDDQVEEKLNKFKKFVQAQPPAQLTKWYEALSALYKSLTQQSASAAINAYTSNQMAATLKHLFKEQVEALPVCEEKDTLLLNPAITTFNFGPFIRVLHDILGNCAVL